MIRLRDFALGASSGAILAGLAFAESTPTLDPVAISPELYTVRFENDRVRVLEYRLKPGGKEPMHSHPPGVVFALANATVRTTLPNGTVVAYPSHAGDVLWREAVTHSAENIGSTAAHYYAVELKDPPR
jgi:quercetin dioxygenase-like cupin family protein